MQTYVLIHGAWHDGSLWEPVANKLRELGIVVHTPTIAGHGPNVDRHVTHEQCTQSIVDYIKKNNLEDFVLVGHSYGGTIISKVAEAVHDRIRRLVYWNAFVLLDGQSLTDNVPPEYQGMFQALAEASGDGSVTLPFPVWRDAFLNDATLELAQKTYATLTPEPYQPLIDKLDLKKFYSLEIPKSYLNCTEDTALPPGEWSWHPRMSSRLGHYRLVQMPGSHQVMFSKPESLAVKLLEAGRD